MIAAMKKTKRLRLLSSIVPRGMPLPILASPDRKLAAWVPRLSPHTSKSRIEADILLGILLGVMRLKRRAIIFNKHCCRRDIAAGIANQYLQDLMHNQRKYLMYQIAPTTFLGTPLAPAVGFPFQWKLYVLLRWHLVFGEL